MVRRNHFVEANRLRHHLVDWGGEGPRVLLLHGYLEHARVWDWVAPSLVAAGYRVWALDWRGHGDSEWVGAGGYYYFTDYMADLAGIVRFLGAPVRLVGHSMGGSAAVYYAGTQPERVAALAVIEGISLPDSDPADTPGRVEAWIADLDRAAAHQPRPRSREDLTVRLQRSYPSFDAAVIEHLVEVGTRPVDGGLVWKFDPLHMTRSPSPFFVRQARPFWERVSAPALYIEGVDSQVRLPDAEREERLAALRARRVTIAESRHHPHVEQPERTAEVLVNFLPRG